MGLLTCGTPLSWPDTKLHADLVKRQGIQEFLRIYAKYKSLRGQPFKWGDEIEFSIIRFDHSRKRAQLLLKSDTVMDELNAFFPVERTNIVFHPEYSNYMIETCPHMPFDASLNCFRNLEEHFRFRRQLVESRLEPGEHIISLTCFPLLGCPNFAYPSYSPTPTCGVTRSLFLPDEAIFSGHPRFPTITSNTLERIDRKIAIYVPIFFDKNTPRPFREQLSINIPKENILKDDHIYMDCTGFGMGCCCLQVTFQAESIDEARFLYDQLTPLTPLLLAMTASSPVWRGYLADVDTRWSVLSASLDDRTDEELGLKPLHTDKFVIRKPRYDSIDSYLCKANSRYNDIPLVIDQSVYDRLVRSGVDHLLAQHIAHLYIREPLVLFKEKLDELLEKESRSGESKADPKEAEDTDVESFENIQSTNWQNMRFKPPPIKSDSSANRIGWRVEVRPMELQLTDFENSAFCSLVILLVKALRKMKLNLLMPISKVDENMKRAQRVNACLAEKFFFRKNINEAENENQCELVEMSVDEIMNGSGEFKGMLNVLHEYLDSLCEDEDDDTELDSLIVLKKNLKFLELRANGTLLTPASYMRKFIREHPLYKFDSVVTHEINYDLLRNIHAVATKEIPCPELLLPEKMELSELRVTQSA